jgi:hypothetical protein
MADKNARDILNTALDEFDTNHLQRIIVAAYDRWNWDTGSDMDKDWFEVAEKILKERGVSTTVNSYPSGNNSISFGMGAGKSFPVLTVDQSNDVVLGTHKSLKVTDASKPGSVEHILFEVSGPNLEISYDLRRALIEFLVDELVYGTTMSMTGKNLKQVIEEKALDAVRNRL